MYPDLAILGAVAFAYSVVAGRLERTPINGALVFVGTGLVLGPAGLYLLNLQVDAEGLRLLAELTLALVLYTDAASANLAVLRKGFRIPQRLLLMGLPLTIGLGVVAGFGLFPGLSLLEVAILATMLAPTDAALGQAVVTNESVPATTREGLNVESGLNDGLCVPILFVLLAFATETAGDRGTIELAFTFLAAEIGIGLAVGGGITLFATGAVRLCAQRGWTSDTWRQVAIPAVALTCFALAQSLGGSGFISCFVGGLLFGALVPDHKPQFLLAAEGTGDCLSLLTWVVFGAAFVAQSWHAFTAEVVVYALLSLTVVRMLPVFLCLGRMRIPAAEKLFIGWFGPRGLASIVFAVIVMDANLQGGPTIVATVVCTVGLSILLHGLTANPLAEAFGRWAGKQA